MAQSPLENEPFDLESIHKKPEKKIMLGLALVALVALLIWLGPWAYKKVLVHYEDQPTPLYTLEDVTHKGVNFAQIHHHYLPQVCFAHGDPKASHKAYTDLIEALAPTPEFQKLAVRLKELRDAPPEDLHTQEYNTIQNWNQLLLESKLPLVLQTPVDTRILKKNFCALAYHVHQSFPVDIPGSDQKGLLRIATRTDKINIREGYRGHASKNNEAIVLTDVVLEKAAGTFWPALAPVDERDPYATLLPRVRRELKAALSPEHFEALQKTASSRRNILEVVESINQRKSCGSRLGFYAHRISFRGFDNEQLANLQKKAIPEINGNCPPLTPEEYKLLSEASATLQSTPNLRHALQALASIAAEQTSLHEIRHLQDNGTAPEDTGRFKERQKAALAEFSAYLGTLTNSTTPYSALYDMCHLTDRGLSGQHRRAFARIENELLENYCTGPLPEDLTKAALAYEKKTLNRESKIKLPKDFPQSLPDRLRTIP